MVPLNPTYPSHGTQVHHYYQHVLVDSGQTEKNLCYFENYRGRCKQ